MDSLKTGYGGYILFEKDYNVSELLYSESKKDFPLNHTKTKNLLGSISNRDTLKLTALYTQCGEFGGNRETILIFRPNSSLVCRVVKDSVYCGYEDKEQKYFQVSNDKYRLSNNAAKAVTDYIELLFRYSLKEKEWHSNVARYFSASIHRSVDYRKDFSVDVFDPEGEWIYFDVLKNEIKSSGAK